ncbi:uncharacterized protein [Diabrotica undecimpunctata]|uniref:uncharacterized protein n=1 Tax=Diabrotica undecimpunctata TaxID=50387 RepID=UPI003B632799
MPNFYTRKSNKCSWREDDLLRAVTAINDENVSVRAAIRTFSVPESTIRYRMKKNDFSKHALGPDSQLGRDTEHKLVNHVKKLQGVGFAPTQRELRKLAYQLAEKLGKRHIFNTDKKIAGKVWLSSFMRRYLELMVRKAQGISRARTERMSREEVKNYFTLLADILTSNDLLNKPIYIWNCDEIGVQLNNEPKKVVASKGSKDVHVVTSAEKGETISILACCNAEEQFLPPYCIFKGVYANLNMQKVLHLRKPPGKNLLILDGHASHMSNADMLQIASDNDIILLCLPSHTIHYLQPLDRVVFKPFKTYFKDACQQLVTRRSGTGRITREDFGELLQSAWSRSATVRLATTAFQATGIHPLDINAIPEHV